MTTYTLTFREQTFDDLTEHLFANRRTERAAYLLCSISDNGFEKRLLVNEMIPVDPADIDKASPVEIMIRQRSYLRAIKRAADEKKCFVFIHSHPVGYEGHSPQDDVEERDLFRTAYVRIHNDTAIHGSLVFSDPELPVGRVWLEDGTTAPIDRVRVIGDRFKFYDSNNGSPIDLAPFGRQILAFGEDVQSLLGRLTVGVVGLGGTGSAVVEQLARLGVGRLLTCDPQKLEKTNVNRVYGSSVKHDGDSKSDIARENIERIGLGTTVEILPGSINDLETAKRMRGCDFIFGCTDDESGRMVLTKLAMSYLIPVFDMGVEIDSEARGNIKSVRGRVTTLIPRSPCLFCRGVITPKMIAAEIEYRNDPEQYKKLNKEGYVPDLPGTAPSVIMFTSGVASTAISEMLHRLTGFMGEDRNSTEVLLRFDESKISTNSKPIKDCCWCGDITRWGDGDTDPFLGLTW